MERRQTNETGNIDKIMIFEVGGARSSSERSPNTHTLTDLRVFQLRHFIYTTDTNKFNMNVTFGIWPSFHFASLLYIITYFNNFHG